MQFDRLLLTVAAVLPLNANAATADQSNPILKVEPQMITSSRQADLTLSDQTAQRVGLQVWRNETGGDRNAITSWNVAENFASMGIGHFIWFPAGLKSKFHESFPEMMSFLREQGASLPTWLDKPQIPPCPWTSRQDFKRGFNSYKMNELRDFLLATVGLQTKFLAKRMQGALPKILATVSDPVVRVHVEGQFNRVVNASPDLYPLIDYVNFKGEGISPKETYFDSDTGRDEGWGLKHVLLEMTGFSSERDVVLQEFSKAASAVLTRRVKNNPPNKRWLRGWLKRTTSYRKPLPDRRS